MARESGGGGEGGQSDRRWRGRGRAGGGRGGGSEGVGLRFGRRGANIGGLGMLSEAGAERGSNGADNFWTPPPLSRLLVLSLCCAF